MAAPGVVAACIRGGLQRAAEIRKCKSCDIILDVQLLRGLVEGAHRWADLAEQILLDRDLVGMSVEASQRAEEDLAVHSQLALHGYDLGHLLQLVAEGVIGGSKLGHLPVTTAMPFVYSDLRALTFSDTSLRFPSLNIAGL